MDARLLEEFTVRLLDKNGVKIDSGAQYSIKCQYAQIENIISDAISEMKDSVIDALQSSFDSDGYNGSGDGSMPLIDLGDAKCAADEFLDA